MYAHFLLVHRRFPLQLILDTFILNLQFLVCACSPTVFLHNVVLKTENTSLETKLESEV